MIRQAGSTPRSSEVVAAPDPVVATVDAAANSAVFVSLTSVLDAGVPLADTGPLGFPSEVWHRP